MKEGEREESQQQHNNSRDNRFTVSKLNVYENYEKKKNCEENRGQHADCSFVLDNGKQ